MKNNHQFPILTTIIIQWVSEWVSDCCLTPIHQFSAISWREQVNFQWHDDEIHFVLDQHAELNFHSASSLKRQLAGLDMSLHSDTLFWFRANQSLLFLLSVACLAEKKQPDQGEKLVPNTFIIFSYFYLQD
jgi:hypothetical protein